jgi:hypothetical protein
MICLSSRSILLPLPMSLYPVLQPFMINTNPRLYQPSDFLSFNSNEVQTGGLAVHFSFFSSYYVPPTNDPSVIQVNSPSSSNVPLSSLASFTSNTPTFRLWSASKPDTQSHNSLISAEHALESFECICNWFSSSQFSTEHQQGIIQLFNFRSRASDCGG